MRHLCFSSHGHFSNTFRRIVGVTPRELPPQFQPVPARLPPLVCRFAIFVAGKIGRSDVLTTLDRSTLDMYSYASDPSESKLDGEAKTEAPRAFAPARRSRKYPAHRQLFGPFLFAGVRSTGHHPSQQYNVLRILRGAGLAGLPTLHIAERMIEQAPV